MTRHGPRGFGPWAALVTLLILGLSTGHAEARTPDACDAVVGLPLRDAQVDSAEPRPAGDFTPPDRPATPTTGAPTATPAIEGLPDFCRVRLSLRPSADSDIRSEVWLPAAWNGRLQMVGNGGWAGVINYAAMGEALRLG